MDATPPKTRPPRIAIIGEAMIELSPTGPDSARIGVAGDTFNTAVYLSRLLQGTGATVSYVTLVGDDRQSDRIVSALTDEGIETSLAARLPGAMPGLYMIELDAAGERSFSYWRSDSAARRLFAPGTPVQPDALRDFDIIVLSAISLAIISPEARDRLHDWAQGFRKGGGQVAFDSNYRPRLWPDPETARSEVARFWAITDIALPSVDDEMALFGDADAGAVMARLAQWGVQMGAMKRGAEGPVALDGTGQVLAVAPVEKVVDTTAAGDSFNAGFLAAWLRGGSVGESMAAGHALAARVIGHKGAILPKPD
ncbi:MAG: sugar kinase [Natronohydrobacter sp.]|nr:sugar kinase [Natronohydrobacter sp.]TVR49193.1 MAG: sugar kinase [Paracoccaceae bacterium]